MASPRPHPRRPTVTGPPDDIRPGPFAALRVAAYRNFVVAQVTGNCGMWLQRAAAVWLVVQLSGGDGVAVGLVTSLQFAPMIVLGLGGSTLGDRFDKRRLMLITQLTVVLGCLAVVALLIMGVMTLGAALAMTALLGIPAAIDAPVRLAYPRQLVPRQLLPAAVGVNGAVFQLARVVGPATAGAVIALLGTAAAFAAAAGLGIIALAALRALPRRSAGQRIDLSRIPRWRATFDRLVPSDTAVPLLGGVVLGIGLTNLQLTVPLVLPANAAAGYGVLLAMIGAGGMIGAALTSLVPGEPRNGRLTCWSVTFVVITAAFAAMPTVPAMAATLFLAGLVMQAFGTTAISALQLRGPGELNSRLMTLYVIAFFAWSPVGAPLYGGLCNAIGPRAALLSSAGVCLAIYLTGLGLLRPGPVERPGLATG